ncbi:MAG: hypothetical protein C0462_08555 [Alcanivorax sp.]|nr:hypothetical protein [Alcanivorax sp.]
MHAFARVIAVLFTASLLGACADDTQNTQAANASQGKSGQVAEGEAISLLQLSSRLARLAIADEDAALMAQAAKIRARVSTEALEAEARHAEGERTATDVDKDVPVEQLSATDMLDLARELAGDNETLLALIDSTLIAEVRTRGLVGGARVVEGIVHARSKVTYDDVYFEGGTLAEVGLFGDGDTDLDLFIYDEFGNNICSSISWDDQEYCAWEPLWTGKFTIEIGNYGDVWNAYILATN